MQALEKEIERATAAITESLELQQPPVQPVPEAREEASTSELQLDVLEAAVASLESDVAEWMAKAAMGRQERGYREDEHDLASTSFGRDAMTSYQQEVLDRRLEVSERLGAIRVLKRFPSEMDALGPVIGEVNDLISTAEGTDTATLAIINTVDGIQDQRIVDPLKDLLARSSNEVQLEIVRALSNFIELPQVQSAFEQLMQGENGRAQRTARGMLEAYRKAGKR